MKYYKNIEGGYITSVSTGNAGHTEVAQAEYENILAVIRNRPTAEDGYTYKLRTDLTWNLVEEPPTEDEDATEADYIEALAELGVSVNEEI